MPTYTDQDPVASSALLADAELVARAGLGDALAFKSNMRRHNRLLFRSARGVVGDDAEAQEVAQETYLRPSRRCSRFASMRRWAPAWRASRSMSRSTRDAERAARQSSTKRRN